MTSIPLPRPLRGIIPPMITPLKEPDRLDVKGLSRLIEHICSGGVHGLFILGSTGEAPHLSYALRRELIVRVCDQVAGRKPVLVGIMDTSFVESINLACHAEQAGAAAVVFAPPYYYPLSPAELFEHVQRLDAELPLPVFLYNMPGFTKLSFEPDMVARAAELPNVRGLKDSSGNMIYFSKLRHIMKDRPDFTLLVGPEELMVEATLLGGHGGVCGGANLFPHLYVQAYEAALAGDLKRAVSLHEIIMHVSTALYTIDSHESSFRKGVKGALSCLNICHDAMPEPFQTFTEVQREQFTKRLKAVRESLEKQDYPNRLKVPTGTGSIPPRNPPLMAARI